MGDLGESVVESNRVRKQVRDYRAWQLRNQGRSLKAVRDILTAEGFGEIKITTVSAIINRMKAQAHLGMMNTIAAETMAAVHAYEHIFSEAMEAWEKSKEPAIKIREDHSERGQEATEDTEDEDGNLIPGKPADHNPEYSKRKTTLKEFRDGDPRYLATALRAKEQLTRLLGLEAPKKVKVSGDEDGPPIQYEVKFQQATKNLPIEDLKSLKQIASKLVQAKEDDSDVIDVESRPV